MGNSQHRYVTSNEAVEILGPKQWQRSRQKLEKGNGSKAIDLVLFANIIHSRFERMPNMLIENLYRAFSSDTSVRVDLDLFLSTLAVIKGTDTLAQCRFLFRVYEAGNGAMTRTVTEEILQIAYGDRLKYDFPNVLNLLDDLFPRRKRELNVRELEQWTLERDEGHYAALVVWIAQVLDVFVETHPKQSLRLYKKYSAMYDPEETTRQFQISREEFQRLRQQFLQRSSAPTSSSASSPSATSTNLGRPELTLSQWRTALNDFYMQESLSEAIYLAHTENFKAAWRFDDFADFCISCGMQSSDQRPLYLLKTFVMLCDRLKETGWRAEAASFSRWFPSAEELASVEDGNCELRVTLLFMVCLVVHEFKPINIQRQKSEDLTSKTRSNSIARTSSVERARSNTLQELQLDFEPDISFAEDAASQEQLTLHQERSQRLHKLAQQVTATIDRTLHSLSSTQLADLQALCCTQLALETLVQGFRGFLLKYQRSLLGLLDLGLSAACLLGCQPRSPRDEKECVMELVLRCMCVAETSSSAPHGVVGTQWALLPKSWYDQWQMFVGQFQNDNSQGTIPNGSLLAGVNSNNNSNKDGKSPTLSSRQAVQRPQRIDSSSLQQKAGSLALKADLQLGVDFEALPAAVYFALEGWYGATGAAIIRHVNRRGQLELMPLQLLLLHCDDRGRVIGYRREMLVLRQSTAKEALLQIAQEARQPPHAAETMRLWDCRSDEVQQQRVLAAEEVLSVVLQQLNTDKEPVKVLLETRRPDGSWPRAAMLAQHLQTLDATTSDALSDNKTGVGAALETAMTSLDRVSLRKLRVNQGRIGLDNLGNTCYLNASLQALLHCDLLVDYFLSQRYVPDINEQNPLGYKGQLARAFGRLVHEFFNTKRAYIIPRQLHAIIGSVREQFAGHEQHDAQELLLFLLDGLSEDVCRVTQKPYITQPDSDSRPDRELADIWWHNHLQRERSLVQALVTGQFRSVVKCNSCSFDSSVFEPFTALPLPLPEDQTRSLSVLFVPRHLQHCVRLQLRLPRQSLLKEAMQTALQMQKQSEDSSGLGFTADPSHILAAELSQGRIRSFLSAERRLESLRVEAGQISEPLVFFEVAVRWKLPTIKRETVQGEDVEEVSVCEDESAYVSEDSAVLIRSLLRATSSGGGRGADAAQAEEPLEEDDDRNSSKDDAAVKDPNAATDSADAVEPPSAVVEPVEDGDGEDDDEQSVASSPPAAKLPAKRPSSTETPMVRVAFQQRRMQLTDGVAVGAAGFDVFRPTPCGLPLLEVLPKRIDCRALYEIMSRRLQAYMKLSADDFRRYVDAQNLNLSAYNASHMTNTNSSSNSSIASHVHITHAPVSAACDLFAAVQSASSDSVFCGAMPRRGFTLRTVNGGHGAGASCSRCHWLVRCDGCVLPDSSAVSVELLDGESLAVDWHYSALEDVVDCELAFRSSITPAVNSRALQQQQERIPLQRCLESFSEEEAMTDVVCSKCQQRSLVKTLSLWRLPPLLVIQLKRFQFDRHTRRKLHGCVDFPLDEALELSGHLAAESDNYGCSTSYRLFSVVHHLGALGSGHYVNTSRALSSNDKWSVFNDDSVSEVEDPADVVAPSAYLLFYLRSDLEDADLDTFLEQQGLSEFGVAHQRKLQQQQQQQQQLQQQASSSSSTSSSLDEKIEQPAQSSSSHANANVNTNGKARSSSASKRTSSSDNESTEHRKPRTLRSMTRPRIPPTTVKGSQQQPQHQQSHNQHHSRSQNQSQAVGGGGGHRRESREEDGNCLIQ